MLGSLLRQARLRRRASLGGPEQRILRQGRTVGWQSRRAWAAVARAAMRVVRTVETTRWLYAVGAVRYGWDISPDGLRYGAVSSSVPDDGRYGSVSLVSLPCKKKWNRAGFPAQNTLIGTCTRTSCKRRGYEIAEISDWKTVA